MNDSVLLELARRWESDAKTPNAMDGSDEAKIPNAIAQGERQAKRECADTLRTLVSMLGRRD
ncbi:MAG TPA: hypothetical protein VGD45_20240 [Steroidobacter sp.]|uniref:hypothetical protein n=1 Tax=Steroidobacter sp. TaxID=1978227 RepID=UPI002ED7FA6D